MAKAKTEYRCGACGYRSAKWLGRCPGCEAWNSFAEETQARKKSADHRAFRLPPGPARPVPLQEVSASRVQRRSTHMKELDRVLGGGLTAGSLVLLGGDPGIGKSTLLLQCLALLAEAGRPAIYVTGEESADQVRMRADRLGITSPDLQVLADTRADAVVSAVEGASAVVVDSIQALFDPALESVPGSVSQIREVAAKFLHFAKTTGIPVILVGHVTKDGALAGPRVLEHLVDTVLYFEQSLGGPYRILRAHKNRFGSTQEVGVFEMGSRGLQEVENPSALFLAERPQGVPGSVVMPALEGSRPILVEVQALVSPTELGTPRRTCLGFDGARASLLVAVLEQRADLQLRGCDVFLNVAGGLRLAEPAADLAVAVALASAHLRRPVPPDMVVFGELGLAGELRSVQQRDLRLGEAEKLGFESALLPAAGGPPARSRIRCVATHRIDEALDFALHGADR